MDFKKLIYKRQYRGTIEKEGKAYRKYKRVLRFPFLKHKSMLYLFVITLLLAIAAMFLLYRMQHSASKYGLPDNFEPQVEHLEE